MPAEILIFSIVPLLAIITAFASYTYVFERVARLLAMPDRVEGLLIIFLIIVLIIFLVIVSNSKIDDAFSIQNLRFAELALRRVQIIKVVAFAEILVILISIIISLRMARRQGGIATIIILAALGNVGAVFWIIRRK